MATKTLYTYIVSVLDWTLRRRQCVDGATSCMNFSKHSQISRKYLNENIKVMLRFTLELDNKSTFISTSEHGSNKK